MHFNPGQTADPSAHLGIADALLRFAAGVDRSDPSLLSSVFADDAVVDFRPCGRKLGLDFPVLQGAETITGFLAAGSRLQVTSHVVTNTRVRASGDASLSESLVDATHLVRADPRKRFRMMNWYEVESVRAEASWRIRKLTIDNVWSDGDAQILMAR